MARPRRVGQLADRFAFLTRRYGSDAAAWQHELHALAALEASDTKAAVERFHILKRRLAEFRRAQLMRALREHPFVRDVPPEDARGYPLGEVEAEIREATRALAHARAIADALAQEHEARASLKLRVLPEATPVASRGWDALVTLAEEVGSRRRTAMREARLEERLLDARRRAARLSRRRVEVPDASLASEPLADALGRVERELARAEGLEYAHRLALAPLKAPEVRAFRDESRRKLAREADAHLDAGDQEALRGLAARAETLREEAAGLANEAARRRRRGVAPPPRERRPGDPIDPYG